MRSALPAPTGLDVVPPVQTRLRSTAHLHRYTTLRPYCGFPAAPRLRQDRRWAAGLAGVWSSTDRCRSRPRVAENRVLLAARRPARSGSAARETRENVERSLVSSAEASEVCPLDLRTAPHCGSTALERDTPTCGVQRR